MSFPSSNIAGMPLLIAAFVGAASPGWASYAQPQDGMSVSDATDATDASQSEATTSRPAPVIVASALPTAFSAGNPPATAATVATTYRVREGDTVSHIAVRTGISTAAIIKANDLNSRGFIRAGQTLRLPGTATPKPAAAPAPAAPSTTYTVKPGDTVSHIAVRTGISTAAIIKANDLNSRGFIRVGQTLALPGVPAATVPNTFLGRTYPDATVNAASVNKEILLSRPAPSRDQMRAIIADTARRYGVDPSIALAVAYQESGFNHQVVSPANAIGAMQVIPSSGRWASHLCECPIDLLDPQGNATAGAVILHFLLSRGNEATALAGYYQGETSVRRNGMYDDTRRYVANVQYLARNRF